VITYEDGISVHFNDEEIRVVHLPEGHTDGDSVVFFTRSGVVHLGDLFFGSNFPFIDIDSGGSVKGYISNLEKLRRQITPDMKIIPGHGKISSLAEYDAYLAMLKDTASRVEKGIRQGRTADQLKKAQVLKGYEGWASSFMSTERFVDILYRGLEPSRHGSRARP
jgi:glyoxylase-like metal-dependent hydrolase (beta-lactamase superfamily II)